MLAQVKRIHLCPYTMQFSARNENIALNRRCHCGQCCCMSCIEENLYLKQNLFFPLQVPMSIAEHSFLFSCAGWFYFPFFLLSVNSIFSSIFRRVCVCEISRPFSFYCCFPLLSSLFTSKNNVCKENIDNLRNESILQKSCRIDFCPVRIIYCHHFDGSFVRLHACACPSMCAFISGLFGENMDDDIWKMVCSNIY